MKEAIDLMLRKTIITALCIVTTLSFTGCNSVFEQDNVVDGVESYNSISDEMPNGLFIKEGDVYYKGYNKCKTYTNKYSALGSYSRRDTLRLIWYTTQMEAVPTLSESGSIIYKSNKDIPDSIILESFEELCTTIGIRNINMNETNGRFCVDLSRDSNMQQSSEAYAKLSQYKQTIYLDSINGVSIDSSMINKAGAISGLEKGKLYRLGFYIGTKYYEADITADTTIYSSKTVYTLTDYAMTKEGYLIVKLPELLEPGLYDMDNEGVFWYGGVSAAEQTNGSSGISTDTTNATSESEEETLPVGEYIDTEPSTQMETDENGEPIGISESDVDAAINGESATSIDDNPNAEPGA